MAAGAIDRLIGNETGHSAFLSEGRVDGLAAPLPGCVGMRGQAPDVSDGLVAQARREQLEPR